jgi:hypothetical protein
MFALAGLVPLVLLFGLSGPIAALYLAMRLNSRR